MIRSSPTLYNLHQLSAFGRDHNILSYFTNQTAKRGFLSPARIETTCHDFTSKSILPQGARRYLELRILMLLFCLSSHIMPPLCSPNLSLLTLFECVYAHYPYLVIMLQLGSVYHRTLLRQLMAMRAIRA
ncbi:uncharacterized protein BDZ99DRAFT_80163 [Mytilinidion resinicola]|uniref:Uncharacterized protein n=1 Tax=Mytilinidion resinicola TaxID=574789 RepID=A0A6A6YF82_9PEZI|nr:uncharacterized protein BDZ99DRAFT_80163 [Mytilinidion resinicola]KAF2807452.1 hypothetical protein BDZ99DRAFT_80163 [Mytilinidion resinicola]